MMFNIHVTTAVINGIGGPNIVSVHTEVISFPTKGAAEIAAIKLRKSSGDLMDTRGVHYVNYNVVELYS